MRIIVLLGILSFPVFGQESLMVDDFRSQPQRAALVGAFSEFVTPELSEKIIGEFRKSINRYTQSYGSSSIAGFSLPPNPNNQYFKPMSGTDDDAQKKFIKQVADENSFEIFVLASLQETASGIEISAQLYDTRIETASAVESVEVPMSGGKRALSELAYRLMDYLDTEGFVHDAKQGFLKPPKEIAGDGKAIQLGGSDEKFSVNPNELSKGRLVGVSSVGGEKTPFWEKWWFWTIVGGAVVTGGSLAYYFLVVDQPKTRIDVGFNIQ